MKKIALIAALVAMMLPVVANAQEAKEINVDEVQCDTYTSSSWRQNWFIQLGVGIDVPFVENQTIEGKGKREITLGFGAGFGHWFSPYLGLRFWGQGGKFAWNSWPTVNGTNKHTGKYASASFDIMWDMFNSCKGVNPNRVFSIIPFAGLGAAVSWDLDKAGGTIHGNNGIKARTWNFPVSAGILFRFRLHKYVDFNLEARAQFLGDNFNGIAQHWPIDVNTTFMGGFTFNLGGREFQTANPCDYTGKIKELNQQVNTLRADLAAEQRRLADVEAQLPCPRYEIPADPDCSKASPMIGVIRFDLNSAKISDDDRILLHNIARWMAANPDIKLNVSGYADKNTGTAAYNKKISARRAQAAYDELVGCGVAKSRLSLDANGSEIQPYMLENDWNRVVIFTIKR